MNRPNKIDALYDGLVVMYKAAGMSVKTVDPLPNQTLRTFKNTPKPRPKIRSSSVGSRTFYASIIVKTVRCGVVLFSNGDNFGVGYSDVDGSVAAMKAHLEKYIINTRSKHVYSVRARG
jgi:hypothetical protein